MAKPPAPEPVNTSRAPAARSGPPPLKQRGGIDEVMASLGGDDGALLATLPGGRIPDAANGQKAIANPNMRNLLLEVPYKRGVRTSSINGRILNREPTFEPGFELMPAAAAFGTLRAGCLYRLSFKLINVSSLIQRFNVKSGNSAAMRVVYRRAASPQVHHEFTTRLHAPPSPPQARRRRARHGRAHRPRGWLRRSDRPPDHRHNRHRARVDLSACVGLDRLRRGLRGAEIPPRSGSRPTRPASWRPMRLLCFHRRHVSQAYLRTGDTKTAPAGINAPVLVSLSLGRTMNQSSAPEPAPEQSPRVAAA